MKLLLFSDLHCDQARGEEIVRRSEDVDVVIGAGDFGNLRQGLQPMIDILSAIARPTALVAGNAESFEELQQACCGWRTALVLHGTSCVIDGVEFFGLGGAVPETPFGDWSWDLSEKAAAELLAKASPGGVLVSHSPPKGILDQDSTGKSLGSAAVRKAIDHLAPRLVVCGHIHASSGRSLTIDDTAIVNAGPQGVTWELSPESPSTH
jgi:Icc-related predicted phosphoesterase